MSISNSLLINTYRNQLHEAIESAKPDKIKEIFTIAIKKLSKQDQKVLIDQNIIKKLYSLNEKWKEKPAKMSKISNWVIPSYYGDKLIEDKPLLTFTIEKILSDEKNLTLIPLMNLLMSKGVNLDSLLAKKESTLEYLVSTEFKEKYKSSNPYLLGIIQAFLVLYDNASTHSEKSKESVEESQSDTLLTQVRNILNSEEVKLDDVYALLRTLKSMHEEDNEFAEDISYQDSVSKQEVNLFTQITLDTLRGKTNPRAFNALNHLLIAYGFNRATNEEIHKIFLVESSKNNS